MSACLGMLITGCETINPAGRAGFPLDDPGQGRYGYLGVGESGQRQGSDPGAPTNRYGAGSGLTNSGPADPLAGANNGGGSATSPGRDGSRNSGDTGARQPDERPYADPVPGKYGRVYSPFAKGKEIDVADFSPGTLVRCPYTQKIFRVP
jgi:hypothetical protein